MSRFDPYHKWLGIPPEDQPADHYRLLGLKRFESDPEVIEAAADQRMAFLQRVATGDHLAESQALLNEIAQARVSLLNPEKKRAYDDKLIHSAESSFDNRHEDRTPVVVDIDESFDEASEFPTFGSTGPERRQTSLRRAKSGRLSSQSFRRSLIYAGVAIFLITFLITGGTIWLFNSDKEDNRSVKAEQQKSSKADERGKRKSVTNPTETQINKSVDPIQKTVRSEFAADPDRLAAATVLATVTAPDLDGNRTPPATNGYTFAAGSARECRFPPCLVVSVGGEEREIRSIDDLPKVHFHITQLNLNGYKQVDNEFLERIAPLRRLRSLSLGRTSITDTGLNHLRGLTNLESLYLPNTQITDGGLDVVAGLPKLKALGLGGTQVGDRGLVQLSPLSHLERLWLDGTKVTDDGIANLRALRRLRQLDLYGLPVSKRGLQHLSDLPALRWLSLGSYVSGLDDSDVAVLERCRLERLQLVGRKITSEGLRYFSKMTTLRVLSIQGTAVRADGLVHIKDLVNLDTFVWPYARVDGESAQYLRKLSALRVLPARFARDFDDSDLENLRGLTRLKELNLAGTQVGDKGMNVIAGMTQLETLNLAGTRLTDTGLSKLRGLTRLKVLYLTDTAISESSMETIAGFRELERLGLAGTKAVTDASVRHLGQLREIKSLVISTNGSTITENGLLNLPDFDDLEELSLVGFRDSGQVTDLVCKRVSRYAKLRYLSISYAKVSATGLNSLARLANLKSLNLRGATVDDAVLHQLSLLQLTSLYLSGTQITDDGLSSLKRFKALRYLSLSSTAITDKGIEYLTSLSNLRTVYLSGTKVTSSGIASLRKALPNCRISGPTRFETTAKKPAAPKFHVIWQRLLILSQLSRWRVEHDLDSKTLESRLKLWYPTWRPVCISGYEGLDRKPRFAVVWVSDGRQVVCKFGLDRTEHQALYDSRPDGYRPVWVDFYRAGSTTHSALILSKTSARSAWRARSDRSESAISQLHLDFTQQGYRPTMFAGSPGWSGGDRYHGMWVKDGVRFQLMRDLTADELRSTIQNLRKKSPGYRPVWVDSYRRSGKRVYSLVTQEGPANVSWSINFDLSRDEFEDLLARHRKAGYVPVLVKVD